MLRLSFKDLGISTLKRILTAPALALAVTLALAACDNAETRAQKHFEAAQAYLAEGDTDRALVELRNVFKLNSEHAEARVLMAETMREQGNLKGAYSQYLRLVEQYPSNLAGNTALAEIAFQTNNPNEARKFLEAATAIDPDVPALQAIGVAMDYRDAMRNDDGTGRATAIAAARKLVEADPALLNARQVLIAELINGRDWRGALTEVDAGLAAAPLERPLHGLRIKLLDQLGDKPAVEAQLVRMTELFPEDLAVSSALVRWYIAEGKADEAEDWLRAQIQPDNEDPGARLTLIRFLAEIKGGETALAELDALTKMTPKPVDVAAHQVTFDALRGGFMFTAGQQTEALSLMEGIVAGAEPSEEIDRIKVTLARMRATTGNQVGARQLIEEVLEHDPGQVGALTIKGAWLLEDDKTDEAIITLRTALGEAPRNADIMTLLARVHEREGNHELIGEMLSLAVEASGRAPKESLNYARYLMKEAKYRSAEDVLIEALRLQNNNVDILMQLTRVHLEMQDWARAEQDIRRLGQIGTEEASAGATEMQAQLFARQGKADDLTKFLENRANTGEGGDGAAAAVIRSHIMAGRVDEALARARELTVQSPNDAGSKFVLASVLSLSGKMEEAETLLQEVLKDAPKSEPAWTTLYELQMRQGRTNEARATLDAAQGALPDSGTLKWVRAGFLEREGDIEGAIAIYEGLYEENSGVPVVANNLASLLSTARDDPESLERAFVVARRLRGTTVPAFQDTFGWIAHRRGEYTEALEYLEPAAKALPKEPSVRLHLGLTYQSLGRLDEARREIEAARDILAESGRPYPALREEVKAAIAALPPAQ